jgi:hypothetical protein
MVRIAVSLASLLMLAGPCSAAGQKPLYLISFHAEGESMEPPRTIQSFEVNGEKRYFRKLPVLTHRNFKAYWAFPAEDGKTWGAVFWLDNAGKHVVEAIGAGSRGQYLATAINRMPIEVQKIDNAPTDGRLVIWKGIPFEMFKLMDKEKKIRRIGEPATADPAAMAARRVRDNPARRTSEAPAGAPLPDDTVVSRIDPATLDAATRDMRRVSTPAKKSSKASRSGVAEDIPFRADSELDLPLPEPDVKRR